MSLNIPKKRRLAPTYFSPNYKYFDQLLQTVKNKTTVLILSFKEFLQTSIRPLISVLYAKGYHDFPLKFFFSQCQKFRRGTLLCFRKILVPKNVRDKRGGGYHDFLSKLFCLTVPKKFVGEPFYAVFQKISGIEKCCASECYITIFYQNFLSHSTETFRRGTLLCCVSENFGYRKMLCFRGLYHNFPSKIFCLTVPKNAVGEPFSLSLLSGMEKVCMRGWGGGGGECHDFPSKISCLTVPKSFVGQPFRVSLISGIEKC